MTNESLALGTSLTIETLFLCLLLKNTLLMHPDYKDVVHNEKHGVQKGYILQQLGI